MTAMAAEGRHVPRICQYHLRDRCSQPLHHPVASPDALASAATVLLLWPLVYALAEIEGVVGACPVPER